MEIEIIETFLVKVISHWEGSLAVLSLLLTAIALAIPKSRRWLEKKIPPRMRALPTIALLFLAFYLAFRDEYLERNKLEIELTELRSQPQSKEISDLKRELMSANTTIARLKQFSEPRRLSSVQ